MGCPKPLLLAGDEAFLARLIRMYRGLVERLIVVLGADALEIESQISLTSARILYNRTPEDGPLSSLKLALETVRGASGLVLQPVDHPLIGRGAVEPLLRAHRVRPDCILLPYFRGRKGHPVLFPAKFFPDLQKAPLEVGARAVTRRYRACTLAVPTEDPGILINIDTPEDYWGQFGFPPLDRRALHGRPAPPRRLLVNRSQGSRVGIQESRIQNSEFRNQ